MADRVIVVGVTRGRQRVPASEIKQMVGRAGRKHSDASCRATVIAEEEHASDIEAEMNSTDSFIASSSLGDAEALAFHILPEIVEGSVSDEKDAEAWYLRSLARFQGIKADFHKVFGLLEEFGTVDVLDGKVKPTKQGIISSRLYLHPTDVRAWKDNFDIVFDLGVEDNDLAVAWALGTVPVTRMSGDFGGYWHVVEMCKDSMPLGLTFVDGTVITVTLWWYVLGGPPVGKMRHQAMSLYRDAGRVCRALRMLNDDVANWGMATFFDELETRCMKRIPSELVELCKLPKITKGRARFLHSMGIMTVDDIRRCVEDLHGEIDEGFYNALGEI